VAPPPRLGELTLIQEHLDSRPDQGQAFADDGADDAITELRALAAARVSERTTGLGSTSNATDDRDLAAAEGLHPDTGVLEEFAEGMLVEPERSAVKAHLDVCLACRVWANPLHHADQNEPSAAVISDLVAASTDVPDGVLNAIRFQDDDQSPQPTDLWRCGREEALLVWIRRVSDDGLLAVVPVVFDVELADHLTLIKPAASNPLRVDLGFMVSVEAHIDPKPLIGKVGAIDVSDDIDSLRSVRRSGARDDTITVGRPIELPDDQRIEYQQVVNDLLGDCAPEAFDAEADVDLS
jgi:hypothetical protein